MTETCAHDGTCATDTIQHTTTDTTTKQTEKHTGTDTSTNKQTHTTMQVEQCNLKICTLHGMNQRLAKSSQIIASN